MRLDWRLRSRPLRAPESHEGDESVAQVLGSCCDRSPKLMTSNRVRSDLLKYAHLESAAIRRQFSFSPTAAPIVRRSLPARLFRFTADIARR